MTSKTGKAIKTTTRAQRVVAGCFLGLTAASLASCSATPKAPAASAQAAASASTGKPSSVVGAKAELSGFRCSADDTGSWTASGTLHNSLGTSQTYRLMVSVAKAKSGTVVGSVAKSYDLKAGEERKVSLPAFLEGKAAKGLSCVSHVVRGTA